MGLITGGHEHDLFAFFLQTNRWFVLGTIHQCDQNHAAVRSTNCRLSGVRWVQGNVFFDCRTLPCDCKTNVVCPETNIDFANGAADIG